MAKVVLVTGAGRGIGAATAQLLAAQGYAVAVNYRQDTKSAAQVVATIQAAGGHAVALRADVTDETQVEAMFTAAEQQLGAVHYLVNNVGILARQASLVDMELARFQQVLLTNVQSCFLCCRALLRRKPRGGAIVNVSSAAARTGSPFEYVDYAASKGAIDSLTKGLALEVASQGIRVNAVRPGFIKTDIHADGGEPERLTRLAPSLPLLRAGEPDEVAQAIAWLLSDQASYVTATVLDVAGGR